MGIDIKQAANDYYWDKENKSAHSDVHHTVIESAFIAGANEVVYILQELVRLKIIKDQLDSFVQECNKDEFDNKYAQYKIDKNNAWEMAKEFLATNQNLFSLIKQK